jgi:hypothetical protein
MTIRFILATKVHLDTKVSKPHTVVEVPIGRETCTAPVHQDTPPARCIPEQPDVWSPDEARKTGGRMKVAYWVLLVIAVALGIFGYVRDMQWLIFVGVAILLVAIAVDPKRSFFGRRKNS